MIRANTIILFSSTRNETSNPIWPKKDPTGAYVKTRGNRIYDILGGALIAGTAWYGRMQIPDIRRPETSSLSGSLKNDVEYLYRHAFTLAKRHRALMTGVALGKKWCWLLFCFHELYVNDV